MQDHVHRRCRHRPAHEPGTPAPTRLRLAAERLAEGPTPTDSPNLLARLAEVINGPGGDERVPLALHAFDTATAV